MLSVNVVVFWLWLWQQLYFDFVWVDVFVVVVVVYVGVYDVFVWWQCCWLLVFGFYQVVVYGVGGQVVELGDCVVMYGDVVVWCVGYVYCFLLWWYVVEYDVLVWLFVVLQWLFCSIEDLVIYLVYVQVVSWQVVVDLVLGFYYDLYVMFLLCDYYYVIVVCGYWLVVVVQQCDISDVWCEVIGVVMEVKCYCIGFEIIGIYCQVYVCLVVDVVQVVIYMDVYVMVYVYLLQFVLFVV